MTIIMDYLAEQTAQDNRPLEEVIRHHILEGILRRMACHAQKHLYFLRGGMLTRWWVSPILRPAQDLDFAVARELPVDQVQETFRALLDIPMEDGIHFTNLQARPIWQETEFPGVKLYFQAGLQKPGFDFSIDVGFNDPLIPEPELCAIPTLWMRSRAEVFCCRKETMIAWKLHGLYERGSRRWRPKDLHDLWLITNRDLCRSNIHLTEAIEAAFASRGDPPAMAPTILTNTEWWTAPRAKARWNDYRQGNPGLAIPSALEKVVQRVAKLLQPSLKPLRGGAKHDCCHS